MLPPAMNIQLSPTQIELRGPAGSLVGPPTDDLTPKLLMLLEGECAGLGAAAAARKHGFSRARYYQLLAAFRRGGALALHNQRRGPKTPSRRTPEVERQIIRHRFLDPQVSVAVIAQKLGQCQLPVSQRSVARTLAAYGLQKKTLRAASPAPARRGRDPAHPAAPPRRAPHPPGPGKPSAPAPGR